MLALLAVVLAGCVQEGKINKVPAEKEYTYVNPDKTKAETDAGIKIDGILDEEAYKNNNWLYLHNEDGGNKVDIAMTSYFGEKGVYFVYDVTESVPIYVNLDRPSYMNSCIEMYLALPHVTSMQQDDVFEIDLMPTGDMLFKRSNGKRDGYTNVTTTNDIMAVLGTTTKGGEVNTADCYGYCMELFIPWDYMQWLDMDVESVKNGFVYINPAHITSYNLAGTDTSIDRYWYFYAQQNGAAFSQVSKYFRFNGQGVIGNVPVTLQQGEHYTIQGNNSVLLGMDSVATIVPEKGYALTSVVVNGKEMIKEVSFNEDGSVTVKAPSDAKGVTISADAQAVTEGKKSLSGKVILNNVTSDSLKGLLLTYIGPKGEKPLTVDAKGNFLLEDVEQGFYTLKAEKEGYNTVSRSIYLNQDFYTELVLEYNYFQVTQGSSWILDEQNDGVLYKKAGAGQILSTTSYRNFTFRANLKYDTELAKRGASDDYTQQRTGLQIKFSNGKTWHIDLLKEKGKYILQYAKISGNNSLTNWQTIHTLNAEQIKRYTSGNGIQLSVMRQGNYAAIWLDKELIKIEILEEKYDTYSARLGFESWAANQELLKVPFSIASHSTVNVKGSPFLAHAKSWNISGQYNGKLHKEGIEGVYTSIESVITTNDVTTAAKDLSPDTKDYSLAYIFKFSNGEQFRVRLHHTDADGVYRIQTMSGSTVAPAWKSGYALTDAQAAKVKDGGIEYRVQISGTTAYIYIDGQEVCTYDLSVVVASGKPSGVDKATAKVGFSLDGNYGKVTELPFKLVDISKDVTVYVTDPANGSIVADKETCKIGDTVKLTITGDSGYYYTELTINGEKIDPKWDGTYSFKASENVYIVTGAFAPGAFAENTESAWNVLKQNQNRLYMNSHASGDSGWLQTRMNANDISTTIKDASPAAKDFSMIYHFDFSNGETLRLRLHHTDADGKYRIQVMDGSTLSAQWKSHHTLTDAEEAKVKGDGIKFRTVIDGTNAVVYLDDAQVCTIDLSKVISTGNASGVGEATVRIKIRMDGNLKKSVEIPYKLVDTSKLVRIDIAALTNGKVTADEASYQLGDTVTLRVTANAGYSQKLYINDEALLLDWKTNAYSFVATEAVYSITGSFEPSLNAAPKDANRWDTSNQAHGIFNAYYPDKDDAWLMEIKGEYRSISVKAKNFMGGDDGNGIEGYAINLGFKLSNGKEYIFRIIRQNGKYYSQRFGINGSDWTKQELDAAAIAAICGEGANFKLDRTAADTLTISVNGVVYDTYKIEGATEATKVTAVILGHYGNKGEKIQIPFVLKTPTDAPDVQLNIPELTGGTVTPAYDKYLVGDTVTLMITPDAGYSQKLYINGEAVLLDWKTNAYSFEAKEEVYNITGSFEPSLDATAKDANRWDTANQAHGILNAYYPNKDDAWLLEITDEYRAISVKAKNYLAGEDGNGGEGFAVVLGFQLSDGKTYSFRVVRENGTYYWQRFGIAKPEGGNDWTKKALDAAAVAAICGDGADFKVERTASDTLTISINGVVCDTYKIAGMALDTTVTKAIIGHYGNRGQKVELPFALETGAVVPTVELHIADMLNGRVASDKEGYKVGDTITLTAAPAEGYVLKSLTVKKADQVVEITKLADGKYSFAAEDVAYTVEAEFAEPIFTVTGGKWDLSDQFNGSITILNKTSDGSTVKTNASNYKEVSVTVKDYTPSKKEDGSLKQGGFSMQVIFAFDNGKQYQVRIHNTDADGNYKLQNMGGTNSITGWKWQADLTAAQKAKLLDGDGVKFTVKLVGPNAELWVDGTKMKDVALGDEYSGKLAQITLCMNGNKNGQNIEIPFELKTAEDVSDVQLSITEPANGTVAADKETYQIGETVTLTVTPAAGKNLKSLTVKKDGKTVDVGALALTGGSYSFVAEAGVYTVEAEFADPIFTVTGGKWDLSDQYNGSVTILNKTADGSTVKTNAKGYKEVSVTVKDYTPSKKEDGSLKQGGFAMQVTFIFDNGKQYQVRIHNTDADGNYKLQNMGGTNSITGWKWQADLTAAQKTKLLDGDGVKFTVKLVGPNAELWVDGTKMKDVALGDEYSGKLAQITLCMNGNKNGQNIEIPFELK